MKQILRGVCAVMFAVSVLPVATLSAQETSAKRFSFTGSAKVKPNVVAKQPQGKPTSGNSGGNRNRSNNNGLAIGIGAAIVGAAIIGGIANSQARPRSYDDDRSYRSEGGDGMSCGQLERRCDSGQEWACRYLSRSERC